MVRANKESLIDNDTYSFVSPREEGLVDVGSDVSYNLRPKQYDCATLEPEIIQHPFRYPSQTSLSNRDCADPISWPASKGTATRHTSILL